MRWTGRRVNVQALPTTAFEITPAAASSIRLPRTHPILVELSIACACWAAFEQHFDDTPDVLILWHKPDGDEEWMTAYVAVSNPEIAARLENGWDGQA